MDSDCKKAHIHANLGILALDGLKNKGINLCVSEEGSVAQQVVICLDQKINILRCFTSRMNHGVSRDYLLIKWLRWIGSTLRIPLSLTGDSSRRTS